MLIKANYIKMIWYEIFFRCNIMRKRHFTKFRKSAIAALCAVAVTCTGLAAACAPTTTPDDATSTPKREDTQLLKNGDFEFFDVPENAVHLIRNVNSWSRSGDSSGAMSGIINTSAKAWEAMSDKGLKDTLDANNDLKPGDANYEDNHIDYNGMDSGDIPYVDPYVAALSESNIGDDEDGYAKDGLILRGKLSDRSYKDFLGIEGDSESGYKFRGQTVYFDSDSGDYYFDEDYTQSVRYATIYNPETHLGKYDEAAGKLGDTKVYLDDDGNYFLDEDKTEPTGNVLMLHNYPTNTKYNGLEQHYTSQTITLEKNTAAEISVWVKTSDLKYDKGYLQIDDQDRGAYIEVTQTVASTTIDSFRIKAINTEKIINDNPALDSSVESNGWLKYTIYVNGCDFADSSIAINLGLGDSETNKKVTGYAFFDDVQVKKFIDLEGKDSEGNDVSTYPANKDKLGLDSGTPAYCALTSETESKIFYADATVDYKSGERVVSDERFSTNFYYLVDLASENYTATSTQKQPIAFNGGSVSLSAALTTTEQKEKTYASAETDGAKFNGFTKTDDKTYTLPDALKYEGGRPTFNDVIGVYGINDKFSASDFNGTDDGTHKFADLSNELNEALTGAQGLEALKEFSLDNHASMLLILSRYGAAYTAKLENATSGNAFTVNAKDSADGTSYKIISFWVKTSDMKGSTAATVKLVDGSDDEHVATITLDTTSVTTDVGDEKDIYNGWVQCFFYVENQLDEAKDFYLTFSFGNTDIVSTASTSYKDGWVAMANIQSLDVDEDVYKLVSENTYAKKLTFEKDGEKSYTPFDDATRMSNVKKGVGTPSNYYGVNGGSSYVTDKTFGNDFDKQNNVKDGIAGLINRDGFDSYDETLKGKILSSFVAGATNWNDVFGKDCYQPLIIVNSLREYYDRVTETDDYIKEHLSQYFIKDEGGNYVQATEWSEDETYYSIAKAVNYGFIGSTQSVSSSSYKTVSVKVMVSDGATAYVYLVDDASHKVMDFDMPTYSFYYDDDGNVLSEQFDEDWSDSEHRAAIVYTLRDDGLYDGSDGVYANLYNLTPVFKYPKFETNTFYNSNGEIVSYDKLQEGELYYSDAAHTKLADHYLCVDTTRVYEYDGSTGSYYYLVNGERGQQVKNFDTQYARYSAPEVKPEYSVEIGPTGGKWVTVNFVIHTGNEEKNYRLELWSGKRGETGENSAAEGAVAFDYSSFSITESNYSNVLSEYETAIKNAYIELIAAKDATKLKDASELNINGLKAIVDELGYSQSEIETALKNAGADSGYAAQYYTFSWYDSAQYVPFNAEIAETGQTGYDYTASSNSETLVYFKSYDEESLSYNLFFDYSAIDQTVDIDTSTPDDSEPDTTDTNTTGESGWLLITSIILVVVLLFALLAILARGLWKKIAKTRGQKNIQKNNYKQRERYIRKLKLVKTAPVEETEEQPAEEPTEEPAEEPEEEPAEQPTEEPAEEPDQPADDENKD